MMDELVAFLRARYDDDERDAIAARDDHTGVYASIGDATWHVSEGDGDIWTDEHGMPVAAGPHGGLGDTGEHMARWDPARVLAEVEAKRRIVDAHPLVEASEPKVHPFPFGCETCHFDREYGVYGDGPCATLKLLASVYADHPDYQQEWRP